MSQLRPLLDTLQVPAEFAHYERVTEAETLARLNTWKTATHLTLRRLLQQLEEVDQHLSLQDRAHAIVTVAAFDGDGAWVSVPSAQLAKGMSLCSCVRYVELYLGHRCLVIFVCRASLRRRRDSAEHRQATFSLQPASLSEFIYWSHATETGRRSNGFSRLLSEPDLENPPRFSKRSFLVCEKDQCIGYSK